MIWKHEGGKKTSVVQPKERNKTSCYKKCFSHDKLQMDFDGSLTSVKWLAWFTYSWKQCSLIWRLRVSFCEINFCFGVLQLFELLRCRERPTTAIFSVEWFERFKCLATGLDASKSSSCLRFANEYPFEVNQVMHIRRITLAEVHVKWSVIWWIALVPIFSADFMNKGASFASCAQAFEVLCWSLVCICWTSYQKITHAFVKFEWYRWKWRKKVPVSGSFWSNLKFTVRNDGFNWLIVRVKCLGKWGSIGIFLLWRLWCCCQFI